MNDDGSSPPKCSKNTVSEGASKNKQTTLQEQASVSETLSFAFQCGPKVAWLFLAGLVGAVLNGLVYPILAYLFSTALSGISSATNEGLAQVRELAYTFLIVGTYALIVATVQGWCFELVAYHATQNLRLQWFSALLRQDTAFFDLNSVGGIANQVGPSAMKYRRGIGRKFGEGIQFLTTGVGGICYAFYSSWRVALVVLAGFPLIFISALVVMKLNQTKGTRASAAYKSASSVAYIAVSQIKTVLSLNGVQTMIDKYTEATQEAYKQATKILFKQGFANGSVKASFMLIYCVLTLYGTFLLYNDVRDEGCDPSGGLTGNDTCEFSGPNVFGAVLGVAYAAQGASQFGNFSEAFTAARIAAYDALKTINRKPGSPEEVIYRDDSENKNIGTTSHSISADITIDGKAVKAILPKYQINSTSEEGLKPKSVTGRLEFKDVVFAYPTWPGEEVLKHFSTTINPGQAVAFVGPSGSGKSTVVAILERFYDPKSGKVELDGIDFKDYNVSYLRSLIGYVGQEPKLFACSIRENIQYGNPEASFEQIQEAAKLANAHDFISSFTDGYDTQVGDGHLSGGQKQRIAIARALVGNPELLILDEATAALDTESELIIQEALDNIVQQKQITTVIIAHRLSTIRNCDIINVLVYGEIVEQGTHEELILKGGYYKKLVDEQEGGNNNSLKGSITDSSLVSSAVDLTKLDNRPSITTKNNIPHLSFKKVKFAYPTRPKKVIFDDFTLNIEKGKTVALVGPSGGGKSTTASLIERFYDPIKGSVRYNGVDISTLNVRWYRDQIGYVGQEPSLFNDTIANNIAYGFPEASRKQIIEAAKQANAHDFIMEFDDNYDTLVGEKGIQLSGGQKQRVAIARALVKKPKVLILDEATSALDNASEAIVQAAIDKLMESREQTCIVIAHRLSTIRAADKIAVISHGKVVEQGTHDDLIQIPNGRYKRLLESSRRDTKMSSEILRISQLVDFGNQSAVGTEAEDDSVNWESEIEVEESKAFDSKRAMAMATPDKFYLFLGAIGAVMAGGVFPMWGVVFSEMINNMFIPVFKCEDNVIPVEEFDSCDEYWDAVSDDMRQDSYTIAGYWVAVGAACLLGNILTVYGFGKASERLNKRVRDSSFNALMRQEVTYFDKRSVGAITSQLQDDAARIHAFSGEPVRSFIIAFASILTGITLSFIHMWQFALLAISCIPVMGFATSLHMQQMLGEDVGDDEKVEDGRNSPGGVLVETLLNIRTVSALTIEKQRIKDYERALQLEQPNVMFDVFMSGFTGGLAVFIQQWVNALQMWFGAYLLFNFPDDYDFKDFLISNFAVLFALFGLGAAFKDISDRKEVEQSARRIFYLLDRKSKIDPLSDQGEKVEFGIVEI